MTSQSNAEVRRKALRSRRELDGTYRDQASLTIQRALLRSNAFMASQTIACYLAMHDEVETSLIFDRAWRAGKSICAPVIVDTGHMKFVRVDRGTLLMKNRLGLWEPQFGAEISATSFDIVVTPVVAFDRHNHRIGMGSGYYDRSFSFLRQRRNWLRPKLLGLAFDCQKVEKISPNPWDIRLYRVISETSK